MQTFVRLSAVLLLLLLAREAGAEEKNGLTVNVSKRTLNRSDRVGSYYTQYDRTQGYKVTIKNTSLRPMPEGEVNWTIVVIKAMSTFSEKYTGVEKLKALRPAESVEMLVGAVPIGGYRYDRDYKDEMEYEVSVTHAGKETLRMSSKPAFAALAKRARLIEVQSDEEAETGAAAPARAPAIRPPVTIAPRVVPVVPVAPAPPVAAAPAPPRAAVPPAPAPAPPIPAAPAPAPAAANPPANDPAKDTKPFDFFNLDKPKPAPPAR